MIYGNEDNWSDYENKDENSDDKDKLVQSTKKLFYNTISSDLNVPKGN